MRKLVTQRHIDASGPGLAMLIIVLVGLTLLNGCGASALDRATTALEVTHEAQAGAVELLRLGLGRVLDSRCGVLETDAEKTECAEGLRVSWQSTEAGMNAGAATLEATTHAVYEWARRVEAGNADEDLPPILVCESFAELRDVVVAWAALAGVAIPRLFECEEES